MDNNLKARPKSHTKLAAFIHLTDSVLDKLEPELGLPAMATHDLAILAAGNLP
jgi:hypothetical protein